jgi:hypothetical protein
MVYKQAWSIKNYRYVWDVSPSSVLHLVFFSGDPHDALSRKWLWFWLVAPLGGERNRPPNFVARRCRELIRLDRTVPLFPLYRESQISNNRRTGAFSCGTLLYLFPWYKPRVLSWGKFTLTTTLCTWCPNEVAHCLVSSGCHYRSPNPADEYWSDKCFSIMFLLFANRRVTHLRFIDAFELIRNYAEKIGQHKDYFDITPKWFWNITLFQGVMCWCLLINELTNIKVNKNVLLNKLLEFLSGN